MSTYMADALRKIREVNQLAQENLAARLDMTSGHISMLENGNSSPSSDTIEKYLTYFENLNANDLFEAQKYKRVVLDEKIAEALDKLPNEWIYVFSQVLDTLVRLQEEYDQEKK